MGIISGLANLASGGVLSGIGSLAKDIRQAITGEISPDQKAEIDLKLTQLEQAASQAQTEINKAEAQSSSIFVAGWRPFIGWVCGFGLLYATVLQPILSWFLQLEGYNTAPSLDTNILMTILLSKIGRAHV